MSKFGSSGPSSPVSSGHHSSGKMSSTSWFVSEIQQMMHGFGDVRRPLQESAQLIEKLVHKQMSIVLSQAAGIASSRNARFIGIEDFLFLLRKDKIKLRRLLRYILLKDKTAALRSTSVDEEESSESESKFQSAKRTKLCYDFLASIDQTGELLYQFDDEGMDEIKYKRFERAEIQSRNMGPAQYMEFCEARQVSFCRRYKSQRFKDWVLSGVHLDVKPNLLALETLNYLAYETVAQIVDLSLLVKQDQSVCSENPLLGNSPTLSYSESIQNTGLSSEMISSPPFSQKLESSGGRSNPQSVSSSTSQSSHSSSSKKCPKKRKKSGLISVVEWSPSMCVTPDDIREAMRRYSHSLGPFSALGRMQGGLGKPEKRILSC